MAVMVRLTVVPNAGEAEVICSMLRLEGILCSFRYANTEGEGGKPFGGWRDVLVDSDDVTRARELLPANL
jgi:hypothetical protein